MHSRSNSRTRSSVCAWSMRQVVQVVDQRLGCVAVPADQHLPRIAVRLPVAPRPRRWPS